MNLRHARILLTGAAGGIGRATALELARRDAALFLVDRDRAALEVVRDEIHARHDDALVELHVADLSQLGRLDDLVARAESAFEGIDVLVNNAGLLSFAPFEEEDAETLETLYRVNVLAPMTLTRAALPAMLARGSGRVVNVGSIFGSIGFAYFAAYSSTKFAVRGFSEALRRELDGTGVGVTYVAPRATRTRLATVFGRMAEAVGMNMDEPARVAERIVDALERDVADRYVGQPEGLFVRLNALLPRLVDAATRKQNAAARPFAVEAAGERAAHPDPSTVANDERAPEPLEIS